LIPVTVIDPLDRPVTSLSKDSFRVLEDGVVQRITSFGLEEGPVSVGLLFDRSGSMKPRIGASVEALRHFFQTTTPGDEFFLLEFSDRPQLSVGFTSNPDDVYRQLADVQPKGWTALLDALALGMHHIRSAGNRRRVLLVLSDGGDNNSRYTATEVKHIVIESDVRIYGLCMQYRPKLLRQFADETGGNVLVADSIGDLPELMRQLATEIRSHYLLGYSSTNGTNDGKFRKVKVELVQTPANQKLRASWRRGYYGPE
jgi:VWFA-related protein